MPSKEFIRSRSKGEVAQRFVAGMLRSWGLTVRETPRGYRPGNDLQAIGKLHGYDINTLVEVKYDLRHSDTGNFDLDINSLKKSRAGILTICTGNPIDTVYVLPLNTALALAERWPIKRYHGEFNEPNALIPKDVFIESLKPKVLTAP